VQTFVPKLKLEAHDPQKDQQKAAQVAPFWQRYLARREELRGKGRSLAELDDFAWLIEELRVQTFAPELKTAVPISPQRLADVWAIVALIHLIRAPFCSSSLRRALLPRRRGPRRRLAAVPRAVSGAHALEHQLEQRLLAIGRDRAKFRGQPQAIPHVEDDRDRARPAFLQLPHAVQ
jgi:hypothetical protein